MIDLSAETLDALGVRPLRSLGGRFNRHWLVESGGEPRVLRRWAAQEAASMHYERQFASGLAALGWPVALWDEPVEFEGSLWSLAEFLPGSPLVQRGPDAQRAQGRLLAELHRDTARIEGLQTRSDWRRCEEILSDPELDQVLSRSEATRPQEVKVVRWHLERARLRVEGLGLEGWSSIPVHGDFAPWNLLFDGARLTGLLDFELARHDHRVADFALSWRGKYDAVIEGYEEIAPLEPQERAAIVPVWWAGLIEGACRDLRLDRDDGGWTVGKLLARSQAMGIDAEPMSP